MSYSRFSIEGLQALIQSENEGEQLEYKRSDYLIKSNADRICCTISAFANTTGGNLILGVDANKTQSTFDAGLDKEDIEKNTIRTEVELWIRQLLQHRVMPAIHNVDIYWLPHPENTTNSILIVHVTPTESGPHQLFGSDEQGCYWFRNGSQNARMRDWQIRDVMNRRKAPFLDIYRPNGDSGSVELSQYHNEPLKIEFTIQNHSDVPAEYFALHIFTELQIENYEDLSTGKMVRNDINGHEKCPKARHLYTLDLKPEIPIFKGRDCEWPNSKSRSGWTGNNVPFKNYGSGTWDILWEIRTNLMTPRYGIERIQFLDVSLNGSNTRWPYRVQTIEKGFILDSGYSADKAFFQTVLSENNKVECSSS